MMEDTETLEIGNPYACLNSKQKEVATQMENLLNGLNYKEVEEIVLSLLQKVRATSLVTLG